MTLEDEKAARTNTASPQEYYEAAVGYNKNTEYYLERFNRFDTDGTGVSWHWPAFFVSFYWLLYRKMWLWAVLYFFLPVPVLIIDTLIVEYTGLTVGVLNLLVWIATFTFFPMYANALYYLHVKKKLEKASGYSEHEEKKLRMIAAAGGTSGAAMIIIMVFVIISLLGIVAAISIPAFQNYTARARVAEGLVLSESVKTRVEEYANQYQEWPQSIEDVGGIAGLTSPVVKDISLVEKGVIVITYSGSELIADKMIYLEPSRDNENMIIWQCEGPDFNQRYLPAICRH